MIETAFELMEYLAERGAPYGIPAEDILEQIPESARSPKVAYEYMQLKDISHIEPLSQGGEPAGDNWLLEDSSVNRARGAETMSDEEVRQAKADGEADATKLVGQAGRIVLTGVALEALTPVAVGAAEAAVGTVVAGYIGTALVVGSCGFLAWRVGKFVLGQR